MCFFMNICVRLFLLVNFICVLSIGLFVVVVVLPVFGYTSCFSVLGLFILPGFLIIYPNFYS